MFPIDIRDQYALDNWAVTDAVFVLGLYSFVLELKTGNETLYIHYIEGIITEIKIDYQSHVEIVNWTGRSALGLRNIFFRLPYPCSAIVGVDNQENTYVLDGSLEIKSTETVMLYVIYWLIHYR